MVRTAVHWWYGCIQLPQSVHRVLSKSWEHMVKNIPAIFNHFPGRKHIYYITLNKELQGSLAFRTAISSKSLLSKKKTNFQAECD